MRAPPAGPKRFYEAVATEPHEGAHVVTLDGRRARTPGRRVLAGPRPLAEAMAEEWAGQGETLDMDAMPLTRLQGRYLDAGDEDREGWTRTVQRYAASDLLCYRGEDPPLARRQEAIWQPYLDRTAEEVGARFAVTRGVIAVDQPPAVIEGVGRLLAGMPPPHRYAASLLTEVGGSAVLALRTLRGDDEAAAFDASRLDERFQAERWGIDAEALGAERRLRRDWDAAVRLARSSVS